MAQDWDIRPRSGVCQGCQVSFEDQQACYSALSFGEEGYRRADYCQKCWAAKSAAGEVFSTWQGVFRKPPPEPEPALRKETAESLLRRLMEQEDPALTSVIYILAVMLERNRLFVERGVQQREDGALTRIYEHKKTGETFLIPDPRLRLNELEVVQEQVVTMLGGKPRMKKAEAGGPPQGGAAEPVQKTGPATDAP